MKEKQYIIKVTVFFEKKFWIGLFERNDDEGFAVARQIFGSEPADSELYDFVLNHYDQLKFSTPQKFTLVIKRKNPKRISREVRKEMKKNEPGRITESYAQEMMRVELEKNKKQRKTISKAKKEAESVKKFKIKQEKKKKKHRGR